MSRHLLSCHIDFKDSEKRVLGCIAHITSCDHIETATNASALYGSEHRNSTVFNRIESMLGIKSAPIKASSMTNFHISASLSVFGSFEENAARSIPAEKWVLLRI